VVAPPACEPGKDTSMILSLHHLAQGLPQLLAVRSPHATGLASSLSGCIFVTGQRRLFRHRRRGGRLTGPAETSCPSRNERSFCSAFRRLSLGGVSMKLRQSHSSVLIRSNNHLPARAPAIRSSSNVLLRSIVQSLGRAQGTRIERMVLTPFRLMRIAVRSRMQSVCSNFHGPLWTHLTPQ
jgi:hypothetical protein